MTQHHREGPQRIEARWVVIGVFVNAVLAAVAVAALFVAIAQNRSALKAVDVANQTLSASKDEFLKDQRPWLIPADTGIHVYAAPQNEGGWDISVQNYGKTPAVNVTEYALPWGWFAANMPFDARPEYAFRQMLSHAKFYSDVFYLGPGGTTIITLRWPLRWFSVDNGKAKNFDEVMRVPASWVVTGRLYYEDVFHTKYSTDFRLINYGWAPDRHKAAVGSCHVHNDLR